MELENMVELRMSGWVKARGKIDRRLHFHFKCRFMVLASRGSGMPYSSYGIK